MIPVILVIFAALFGEIVSAITRLDWDDHACALQTVVETPEEARHQLLRAGVQTGAVRHHQEHSVDSTACPTHTVLYNYNVTFSYQVARDWIRLVYALTPMGLPDDAVWEALDRISFAFRDCTCQNPDLFSDLEMAEYTTGNTVVGERARFTEVCGGADRRTLVFEDIRGELAKDTYRLKFTLMSHKFSIGAIQMGLVAGSHESSVQVCGTICNPGATTTPATTRPGTTLRAENDTPGSTTRRPGPAVQAASLPPSTVAPLTPASPSTTLPVTEATPASAGTISSPMVQETQAAAATVPDEATTFGDPHVGNLKGERFNIVNPDNYTFLVIPRGSDEQNAQLHLIARVERPGPLCNELLFITGLTFTGQWLGEARQLELSTRVDAGMDVRKALRIRMGGSRDELDFSSIQEFAPSGLVEVTEFHPEKPGALNQHVTTLLMRLRLGPCTSKVRMVYQKEKDGFSNALWLTTSGLRHVKEEIGGILGVDDHEVASTLSEECETRRGDTVSPEFGRRMHALAEMEDDVEALPDL